MRCKVLPTLSYKVACRPCSSMACSMSFARFVHHSADDEFINLFYENHCTGVNHLADHEYGTICITQSASLGAFDSCRSWTGASLSKASIQATLSRNGITMQRCKLTITPHFFPALRFDVFPQIDRYAIAFSSAWY